MAGLTLLKYLIEDAKTNKQILLIDQLKKNRNDKTYSFWYKNDDFVKNINHKKWEKYKLKFEKSNWIYKSFLPYKYFSVRSLDFYNYVFSLSSQHQNITFLYDEVLEIDYENQKIATQQNGYVIGNLIFNSTFKINNLEIQKPYTKLLQHFKGYVIETEEKCFNPNEITLMDFAIPQKKEIHFF